MNDDMLLPEQRLLIAVIKQAVLDKDREYFKSKVFKQHCQMLGIDIEASTWDTYL